MEVFGLFYKVLLMLLINNQYGSFVGKFYLVFNVDENVFDFDLVNKIVIVIENWIKYGLEILDILKERMFVFFCINVLGGNVLVLFILKS